MNTERSSTWWCSRGSIKTTKSRSRNCGLWFNSKGLYKYFTFSKDQIDNWLLQETAFVSKSQQAQNLVNTSIPVTGDLHNAYKPPEYGRALVYEVTDEANKKMGVIDVKGAGGINPSHASHRSGTMTLGESLREFSYEKIITTAVDHSAIENKVVVSYAVIYPGFGVVHENGSWSIGGFYLRQGYRRWTKQENSLSSRPRGNGWMEEKWRNQYDDLLKRYGIFANNNYQGTVKNDLFDFGYYIVREDMTSSVKELKVPFDQWGFNLQKDEAIHSFNERWKMSKADRPWAWAHEIADAYVNKRATRHHVWQNHYNRVNPVQEKLKMFQNFTT